MIKGKIMIAAQLLTGMNRRSGRNAVRGLPGRHSSAAMGAVGSTPKGELHFSMRAQFSVWPLHSVLDALDRFKVLKRKDGARGAQAFTLNRREYWEVFTDYHVLTNSGEFLSLPVRALFGSVGAHISRVAAVVPA